MTLPTFHNMTQISIQSNRLEAWSDDFFKSVPVIEELFLSHNRLSDPPQSISLLAGSLRWLDLAGNQITSLSIFADLTLLEELWLNDNKIEDEHELEHLKSLTKLETVYLERNPLKSKLGPSYRKRILDTIPWLKQLDAITLSGTEVNVVTSKDDSVKPIMKRHDNPN
eukprot:CAMPEP_0113850420 /NCGR_PEP_ID=MMETSP0372-20130328/3862_1 /TAXON_ID=340204 /ORGANISM="Lankesteria abbotti" /LENGTH=167 /DNA_ID=CAMNT_0000820691 /DNA_START=446 /DNA_END=949 /DNA_ORIENTATION=- /assembly_acc=CAM_ASM_000359